MLTNGCVDIGDMSITLLINGNAIEKKREIPTIIHTHFYSELFVCTSGEITISTELGETKLFGGDIAIMPPNRSHSAFYDSKCDYFTIGLIVKPSSNGNQGNIYTDLRLLFETDSARIYRRMKNTAEQIKAAMRSDVPYTHSAVKITSLLIDIANSKNFELLDARHLNRAWSEERNVSIYMMIEDIINTYYTESINYSELTSRLHISRRHLDRLVHLRYGKTLRELVCESRINLSKRLLDEGDASLDMIAMRVGFPSTAAFRNCFIKEVGKTPTEYRKR